MQNVLRRMRPPVVRGAARVSLQGYGQDDPNAMPMGEGLEYSDAEVFNPPQARLAYGPDGVPFSLDKRYTSFPFRVGAASKLILPDNPRRVSLLIQNKSATIDLFINFGTTADELSGFVIPGGLSAGILLDVFCPKNAMYVSYPAALSNQLGVVFEGTQV